MVFIVVAIMNKNTDLTQNLIKRHCNTHLVNNDRDTDSFFVDVLVTMMWEDPEEHKLIRKRKILNKKETNKIDDSNIKSISIGVSLGET